LKGGSETIIQVKNPSEIIKPRKVSTIAAKTNRHYHPA